MIYVCGGGGRAGRGDSAKGWGGFRRLSGVAVVDSVVQLMVHQNIGEFCLAQFGLPIDSHCLIRLPISVCVCLWAEHLTILSHLICRLIYNHLISLSQHIITISQLVCENQNKKKKVHTKSQSIRK